MRQGFVFARALSRAHTTFWPGLVPLLWAVAVSVGGAEPTGTSGWVSRFITWHRDNEFRALARPNSANLAWFEANLLRSYLNLFSATADTFWLDRFTFHADSLVSLMRDFPDSDNCWPGYQDGFLGWGTTSYDPQGRYQEYLVHDAVISLPLARFIRLVSSNPGLQQRFRAQADRYQLVLEDNIVAKWARNWGARRGTGGALESFGGWLNLPVNQFLAFGELLLVLSDIHNAKGYVTPHPLVPATFYTAVPESMAALFYDGLCLDSAADAWVWTHWPTTVPDPRPEDIAHANLDLSFALAAAQHQLVFTETELGRFSRTFTRLVWNQQVDPLQFRRFVAGRGEPDSILALESWVRLAGFCPPLLELVSRAIEAIPAQLMNVSMASTSAQIAALTSSPAADKIRNPHSELPTRSSPVFAPAVPGTGSAIVARGRSFPSASGAGIQAGPFSQGACRVRVFDRAGRHCAYPPDRPLSAGVYLCQFEASGRTWVRPLVVIR